MDARIGIFSVSFGLLEQMLHLPEGHRIRGLRPADNFSDSFEVAVEGPSLPLRHEGDVTPRVTFTITVTENRDQIVPARIFTGKFEETR